MIYLIDFENVSNSGFNGIETLTDRDEIKLFYSEKNSKISIGMHRKLESTAARKEYLPIKTGGKNALDFQLATWLGYLISQNKKESYCIVSNDTGFDYVIDFWKKHEAKVMRSADLNGVQSAHVREQIREILPEDVKDDAGKIMDLINKYKTKQGINNALVKKYGSEHAGVIYKALRPMLASKKGK